MRTTLIFPPEASPSYTPLGVATLASFLRERRPNDTVVTLDLNIECWHFLARKELPTASPLLALPTNSHSFFEMPTYGSIRSAWAALQQQFQQLRQDAKHYLQTAESTPALDELLAWATARILHNDPELVGFSVMFLDQMPFALALAKSIAQSDPNATHRRIILGGAAVSAVYPQELLAQCPFLDLIVEGEGEGPLLALSKQIPPDQIPGIYHKFDQEIRFNRANQPFFLDASYTLPEFSDLDLALYLNPEPVLPVVLSRGCGWNRCKFCAHNFSFAGYRVKEIDAIVDYLAQIQSATGCCHFYFADQYVTPLTLDKLSDALLWRQLRIQFHVMGRPTADYTPALLEKASSAGCRWISWGVETGSQRLLDLVGKGTRVGEVAQVLKDASQAGIANLMMMIFGLPTSTDQDLDETFAFVDDVYPSIAAMTASSFVLFDGTPFARNPSKYDLEITGHQDLLHLPGGHVRTRRLHFHTTASTEALPSRGQLEIARWERRRPWLGDPPFAESLPCEHFLLYSCLQLDPSNSTPLSPLPRTA
ncbi:MAG TPA: B12-binding domain-containing radical SAM protein [Verrucomicrobia bacterium]|nr:B12-binding domain-containing radical SAM protein [Verrucomicrobiota bacterium]